MPRCTLYRVRWLPERGAYAIEGGPTAAPDGEDWYAWLAASASFAFQARSGAYCTVRSERMRRGGAYWYAYRSRQGRTVKRYAGRTRDLSIARLEETVERIAQALDLRTDAPPSPAAPGTAPAASTVTPVPAPERQIAPLLASKLHPPRTSGALVARTRLLDRLTAGRGRTLTLLSAPAGFGKTTLLCQWIAAYAVPAGLPVAWVSLDAGDDDPIRFWRYVIAACQVPSSATRGRRPSRTSRGRCRRRSSRPR